MNSANYIRKYGPSRPFRFSNANQILTGAMYLIDFDSDDKDAQLYLPFDNLRIINNSSYDIDAYINQDKNRIYTIPAGTIFNADATIIPAISYLKIINAGTGTISAGQIITTVQKIGVGADTIAQNLHQFVFGVKKGGLTL